MTKNAFDLIPNLTETFDQLKSSSKIWSSDQLPLFIQDVFVFQALLSKGSLEEVQYYFHQALNDKLW